MPRTASRATPLLLLGGAILLLALPTAGAHVGIGSGDTIEFRMPVWVVWLAGALVVALSFALVAAYLTREDKAHATYRDGARREEVRLPRGTGATPLRLIGLTVLVLVAINAFRPASVSVLPLAAFWLGIWVILPLVAYTLGDAWPRIDPFRALAPLAKLLRGKRAPVTYPHWLGAWPATFLFLALVAFEVSSGAARQSAHFLGMAALAYTLLTVVGMAVFGASAWLLEAEVIGRALRWWHAVSPIAWKAGRPHWRGLTHGLAALPVTRLDGAAFTIAVLYGVNHDALMHTALGNTLLAALTHLHVPAPQVAILVLGYLFFLCVWLLAARGMRDAGESLEAVPGTAARFAATLLPIAAAYHLAHNIPYLLQHIPLLVRGVVDPLGLGVGGRLLASESFTLPAHILPGVAAAQVLLIVVGHLVAVLGAHRIAAAHHPSRVQAVRAETPLTLVMILYTGLGLAILSATGVTA